MVVLGARDGQLALVCFATSVLLFSPSYSASKHCLSHNLLPLDGLSTHQPIHQRGFVGHVSLPPTHLKLFFISRSLAITSTGSVSPVAFWISGS